MLRIRFIIRLVVGVVRVCLMLNGLRCDKWQLIYFMNVFETGQPGHCPVCQENIICHVQRNSIVQRPKTFVPCNQFQQLHMWKIQSGL